MTFDTAIQLLVVVYAVLGVTVLLALLILAVVLLITMAARLK